MYPLRGGRAHNGLPVEATQLSIHYDKDGNVKIMHGKLAKKLPSENPTITEEEALRIALATVKAEKYIWEDPQWEQQIKQDLQDDKATYYPKGQLMYARLKPIDDFTSVNFALVYKFEINSLLPSRKQEEVMVDAKTSKVVRKRDMRHEAWGTVNTLYDGTLGFVTKWKGFPNYDYYS